MNFIFCKLKNLKKHEFHLFVEISPEKHVFETAQILEFDEIPGHVLDLIREFQSPYPRPTKNDLYEFAELEFTTMRGIKATNLEYKERLVQVELKIDLSKL